MSQPAFLPVPPDHERHIPVLLDEVLEHLAPKAGDVILDGTFGAGGYTRAILNSAGCNVIAIDRDPTAIAGGASLVAQADGRLALLHGRFGDLEALLAAHGVHSLDAAVFDLGVSSMQLDEAARGFSFRVDGPLDMRMGNEGPSAADLVNTLSERALADIIYHFGEEKKSRRVAGAIVRRRAEKPFERTLDLADLIASVVGKHPKDPSHPATRSFQGLRIAVNTELEEVAKGLAAAEKLLKPDGRLVVVTFHSLEDRIAKLFFAERTRELAGSRHLPQVAVVHPSFALSARKPVAPSDSEVERNPRARSAKLRAGVRLDAPARVLDLAALGVPVFETIIANRGGRP